MAERAVANRVLSVGDAGRGKRIAAFFDDGKAFVHSSSRGFVVYTGHFNKVPCRGAGEAEAGTRVECLCE